MDVTTTLHEDVLTLHREAATELENILQYWMDHTIDAERGGFVGKIDHQDVVQPGAEKGVVLNARILWSFSAGYNLTKNPAYLSMAKRAFDYITKHFVDPESGGVYWTVNANGLPSNTKKQVYAQAFVIYACSEYFIASDDKKSRKLAVRLYHLVQQHSYDPGPGGYFEAFTRDWQLIDDARLSDKDANEVKTMNTHLHVLEAYSTLYKIWPDNNLADHIKKLLANFSDHIVDKQSGHLRLFFSEDWSAKGTLVSFGHDIEASWLLQEAAESIGDKPLINSSRILAIKMADAAARGLDSDGGLWYEYEPEHDELVKEKHWWPQAEAVVGFVNAWQVSDDSSYLEKASKSWQFIKSKIIDQASGEWVWGIDQNDNVLAMEDKVGIWKCPYHNSRACIEVIRRLAHRAGASGIQLILCLAFLFVSIQSVVAQTSGTQKFFRADDHRIRYTGRIDFSNVKLPRFWQPGVYFETRFKGDSCSVILNDEILWGKNHNYLEVVVDGRPMRLQTKAARDTIVVKGEPGKQVHTLLICKNTEANIGWLELVGIIAKGLKSPGKKPKRRIECIGNSITCGASADLTGIPCGKGVWQDQHNAYLSYGAVTARALDAGYHLSSVSGIGLMHSCCNLDITMPQVYDKVSMRDDSITWNFKSYVPDIVTICLGQNDGVQDSASFTNNYISFLHRLRGYYPKAVLLCTTSPMADARLRQFMSKTIASVVGSLNREGDSRVAMYVYSKQYHGGCDSHPDLKDHAEIAVELSTEIKKIMRW